MLKKEKKQTKDLDVSKIGYMFAEQIIKKIINEYPYICPEIIIFAKKIRQ
ncbi:hypothetical protein [Tannerella forsythia]|nr:hypothetical protein [Tannerella forsythia]